MADPLRKAQPTTKRTIARAIGAAKDAGLETLEIVAEGNQVRLIVADQADVVADRRIHRRLTQDDETPSAWDGDRQTATSKARRATRKRRPHGPGDPWFLSVISDGTAVRIAASVDPSARLNEFARVRGAPCKLVADVRCTYVEAQFAERFVAAEYRAHSLGGKWFDLDANKATEIIKTAVDSAVQVFNDLDERTGGQTRWKP